MRLKPPLSVEVITKSISKNSLVNKMKEKIKKTYLGSRSVYLTHLEPTVLMVVVVKSINKKYVSKQKKKREKKNLRV